MAELIDSSKNEHPISDSSENRDLEEDLESIKRGLQQSLEGQCRPASDFFLEFETENGL